MGFGLSWKLCLSLIWNSSVARVREIIPGGGRLTEHAERANQIQECRRIVGRPKQRKAIIETDALRADSQLLERSVKLRELLLLG